MYYYSLEHKIECHDANDEDDNGRIKLYFIENIFYI